MKDAALPVVLVVLGLPCVSWPESRTLSRRFHDRGPHG